MKRARLLLLTLAAMAAAGLAAAAEAKGWTPEMTVRVRRVGPVRVSPDGSRAAFVVGTAAMDGVGSSRSSASGHATTWSGNLRFSASPG